ncbi:polyprenyl synthetase family protein [Moraxella nasovis]|uniref:polyprenyl synthetase family protein n=1 Tax=Moraxella nasovis TaxID=2904121 RepID=UPI001F605F28|nr:farnesyl diphosphate synthase [Moraxella nasovis]UNU73981.1 polyprenyl synthetase family protein [Moraxella nasovis]
MTTFSTCQTTLYDVADEIILQLHDDLAQMFDDIKLPNLLDEAARYAMSNGGKRVRPLLVAASFLACCPSGDISDEILRRAMMAVELIHGYSLVHDDLPCMDDDELRRGKPTCHVVYGEATALLVGDVLQSLAFEVLTAPLNDQSYHLKISRLLAILSKAARQMVAGQQLDLSGESCDALLTQAELEAIHRQKTGALIEAAVLMGAVCANVSDDALTNLRRYAHAIGLAFQVQDDVLDVVSDTATLGKPTGSDEKLQKSTYVRLLGVKQASAYANQLFDDARQAVLEYGEHNLLIEMIDWLEKRTH